jgi:hypothetical protein
VLAAFAGAFQVNLQPAVVCVFQKSTSILMGFALMDHAFRRLHRLFKNSEVVARFGSRCPYTRPSSPSLAVMR